MSDPASSLLLAPTLAPLVESLGDPVAGLRSIANAGFRAVQLSGSIRSMRARELDRSARRDVLARLRRLELMPAGIDLWIPPEHFNSPDHADRAVGVLVETIELAADLGCVPVSIELPEQLEPAVREAVINQLHTCGVALADYSRFDGSRFGGSDVIGSGIDPAVEIAAGRDPVQTLAQRERIVAARFSDADSAGRVTPGRGRLDVLAYQAGLVTFGYQRPVILDLRRITHPIEAMAFSRSAWEETQTTDGWV